jgi:hypothetical protein
MWHWGLQGGRASWASLGASLLADLAGWLLVAAHGLAGARAGPDQPEPWLTDVGGDHGSGKV